MQLIEDQNHRKSWHSQAIFGMFKPFKSQIYSINPFKKKA